MQEKYTKKYKLWFLIPSLIIIGIFIYYALFATFYYSLFNWRDFSKYKSFIGIENYKYLFKDISFIKAIKNTFILLLFAVVFQIGIALVLALIVDTLRRGYKFFRTIYLFPVIISGSAIGLLFYLMYSYDYGLLNSLLSLLGKEKVLWITPKTALWAVLVPVIWQYVGFYFVIILAALYQIPQSIHDAAKIDGFSEFKKAFYISIPLIWDVLAVCISLVIIGTFKVFDVVYVITGGGPMDASQVLGTYLYTVAFTGQNQGYASAIGTFIIFLGIILSLIAQIITKRERIIYQA
jgi:raffinose/stachyose/melibiose transport system permease protein